MKDFAAAVHSPREARAGTSHRTARAGTWAALALALVGLGWAGAASASAGPAAHGGGPAKPPTAEQAAKNAEANARCIDCHSDPELTADDGRSMTFHGEPYADSVHGKNACTDCHTDALTKRHPRENLGKVQLGDCAGCHADAIRELQASVHATDKKGNPATVETCSNCHEAPHEIKSSQDPASAAHVANVTDTCGTCHRPAKKTFAASAHGLAAKEGEKVPSCTSCHGDHNVVPAPATAATRAQIANDCGGCHEKKFETFADGFHGKATLIGFQASATCSDCHTPHDARPASDPQSSVHPDNLAATCGTCHESEVRQAKFLTFNPHIDAADPNDNFYVYVIYMFMTALLLGVFGFFGLHMLLWFQRALVGKIRGEFPSHAAHDGVWVKRFSNNQIWMHVTIILSFLLLAASGLPLKFAGATWAEPVANLLGGAEMAAFWHRVAGAVTFGYFGWHILSLALGWFVKKDRGYFWGWRSMTPQLQDGKDLIANLKYFLYLGPRPQFDRWTYWEKFDYLAVFWGVAMIGISGLLLWFPGYSTMVLPGWALNAAYVIHSDEALLATGFIFLFHFFHTHLRPESFPMDPVVFTGSQPLARLKDERPREYERLVATGKLDSLIVPPPTKLRMTVSYVFGFLAVAIGVALAIGIFVGLAGGYGL